MGEASIIVAEREPVARNSLSELFRYDGYQVHEAADSNSAILHLNHDAATRLLMLDMEMPFWRSVVTHAHESFPIVVILGMTIKDSSRSIFEAQRLGVHGLLIKPLDFSDVCENILLHLRGKLTAP